MKKFFLRHIKNIAAHGTANFLTGLTAVLPGPANEPGVIFRNSASVAGMPPFLLSGIYCNSSHRGFKNRAFK